ncbi:hypothetical protein CJF32_00003466 [Rutstroemia sp. NJR-2017a WRK4]|nr:hypothetical protein CJF32_00003466 [Rutstroemia sp. NJR-2017a WRK4]
MPFGGATSPAKYTFVQRFLAYRWRAHAPYSLRATNVQNQAGQYSSIAAAMLKRAANNFEPPKPKNNPPKQVSKSSNPPQNVDIQESFKKIRSSQTIGGFTGYTNSTNPPNTLSTNVKATPRERLSSVRPTSTASSNLTSVFSRQDAFQDTPSSSVDLTQDERPTGRPFPSAHDVSLSEFDDFPDDDQVDLDNDVSLPLNVSMPAPPKPSRSTILSSPFAPRSALRTQLETPSSALTWSSSPPSHKDTPPGALKRRELAQSATIQSAIVIDDDEEPNPRPDKQKKKLDDAEMAGTGADAHSSKKNVKLSPIQLTDEQNRVKELVVNQGKSVFFTGSAGTGKSVLMRAIIAALKKKYVREADRVAVTASTGLAACNIGGVTLHSFGGIGLGKEDIPTLLKKIKRNQKAKNRWLRTKVLIVDEISMVDGDLFDKLEAIARGMRNNGRPFGGIQLVITGDFFQLPPVPDQSQKSRGVKFAFDAATWNTAIHHTIGLTEVFRQKDPVFANMLNEMRLGKVSQETINAFAAMKRTIEYEDNLAATELFPTRQEVENSNAFRMRNLHGKLYKYEAVDTGTITDLTIRDKLLSNMMAPKTIELKKGAQVMLIKNMDDGLVNGSLGKVVAFMSEKSFKIYDENPDILNDEGFSDMSQENQRQKDIQKFKMIDRELPNTNNSGLYPLYPTVAKADPPVKPTKVTKTTKEVDISDDDYDVMGWEKQGEKARAYV